MDPKQANIVKKASLERIVQKALSDIPRDILRSYAQGEKIPRGRSKKELINSILITLKPEVWAEIIDEIEDVVFWTMRKHLL